MQTKKNFKIVFISIIFAYLFIGCAAKNSVYSIDDKVLNIGKNNQNIVSVKLDNPTVKRVSSMCVLDSYTLLDKNLNYGNIFIESISLDNNCHWRGLPSGYFESNFKSNLKLKSMQTVEKFDINGYSFKTFKINNDSYLNMIYIYSGNNDRFIIDYKGKLYDKVLKTFKTDYVNKYFLKKRFEGRYKDSLVRKNFINRYFEREKIQIKN